MYISESSEKSGSRVAAKGRFSSLLVMVVILSTTVVGAQPYRSKKEKAVRFASNSVVQQANSSQKKNLVGSWIETVTFEGGFMPPLKSLVNFSADGTVTVADQGNVNLSAGQLFSAGTGAWAAQGDRNFSWTVLELISDLNGNLVGTLKVRGTYTVDNSGNNYSGVFQAQVLDTSDNVLFSVGGTNTGRRIEVEPLQ
jgi:hypothetical protein